MERDPDWLHSAETAAVRKAFEAQKSVALNKLFSFAMKSPDADVRGAYAEYAAFTGAIAAVGSK